MASEALVARLEAAIARLEQLQGKGAAAALLDGKEVAPSVSAFDDFYAANVAPFDATCKKLDQLHVVGAAAVAAFGEVRKVIEASTECKQPDQKEFSAFLAPLVAIVNEADKRAGNKQDPYWPHYKGFHEFIQLVNWVAAPGPVQVVTSTLESSQFYLDKVLVYAKDKADAEKAAHREFVAQIKKIINELAEYVKQFFKMGLVWKAGGKPLSQFHGSAGAGAASSAPVAPGGPPASDDVPPPPPVDDTPLPDPPASASAPADKPATKVGGMAAVFEEINKRRDAAAAGLSHVTKDMKTKNQKDKPALAPAAPKAAPAAAPKVVEAKDDHKPPSMQKKMGTLYCEHFDNKQDIDIKDVQMKEAVYIYKCTNSFIRVNGKVKSIQLDGCFKCTVVLDAVVGTFEIVNSKRVTAQILQNAPSVVIDKSSGVVVHLTEAAMQSPPTFVSSMSSEMNITIPNPAGGDPIEQPVAEQFQTIIKNGKLVTEPVTHSAA